MMIKLSTPAQYETGLDGLNDLRPLELKDEGKVVIENIVGTLNPPSKGRPAKGMMLQCNKDGALLHADFVANHSSFELIDAWLKPGLYMVTVDWAQKVYGVLAYYYWFSLATKTVYWVTPDETNIKQCPYQVYTWLPFIGTTMYLRKNAATGGSKVYLYGVY